MAKSETTDAEIVERLAAIKKYGSARSAARALGINAQTVLNAVDLAGRRGLTADTIIQDPLEVAKLRVKSLEKEVASITRDNVTAANLRKTIFGLWEIPPEPPKWLTKKSPTGLPGVPMFMWSDWHWGERVVAAEVGNVNEFNRDIAKARLKRLVNVGIDLAVHHMVKPEYPGAVVCLGGDIISGGLHEELRETNEGTIQECLIDVQDQLCGALKVMADTFGKLYVPCVVGNHGRTARKPPTKKRALENYEWGLYQQIARYFKNDKRVHVDVRDETDAYFTVLGHRFLLTHGDALGVRGGDGIIGALGPIARGTFKVGRSEAQVGRDFDTMVIGHWHTYIPRSEAVPVIVNGTLKGYDEFARLFLRVPYSRPSQALWFVHQKHGVTAQWQIYLDEPRTSGEGKKWVSFEQVK